MQPDVRREQRAGWGALAGAAALCALALGWYSSDDGLAAQLESAKKDHDSRTGPELMSDHVAKQERANQDLAANIDELKRGVGFTVSPFFTLKESDLNSGTQPGTVFKDRFATVHDEIYQIAHDKGIKYDEYLGFTKEKDVPPGQQVPFLLTMLQLTRKATKIAFGTPTPIAVFSIQHDAKPRPTGPKGRPLENEYGLTMEVTGSLRDVLWILFHLSIADKNADDTQDPGGYPLVLQELTITSSVSAEVLNAGEVIQQIKATFRIAGMQFIADAQRTAGRVTAPPPRTGGSRIASSSPAAPASPSAGVGARP